MLDPIPTSLTKQCLDDLVSLIMFVVNASLSTGIVPPQFKQAIVTPLLKKPGLDTNNMKNFRPESNLSFIPKILENVVLIQLRKKICLAIIFLKSFSPLTGKTTASRLPY